MPVGVERERAARLDGAGDGERGVRPAQRGTASPRGAARRAPSRPGRRSRRGSRHTTPRAARAGARRARAGTSARTPRPSRSPRTRSRAPVPVRRGRAGRRRRGRARSAPRTGPSPAARAVAASRAPSALASSGSVSPSMRPSARASRERHARRSTRRVAVDANRTSGTLERAAHARRAVGAAGPRSGEPSTSPSGRPAQPTSSSHACGARELPAPARADRAARAGELGPAEDRPRAPSIAPLDDAGVEAAPEHRPRAEPRRKSAASAVAGPARGRRPPRPRRRGASRTTRVRGQPRHHRVEQVAQPPLRVRGAPSTTSGGERPRSTATSPRVARLALAPVDRRERGGRGPPGP